MNDFLSDLRLAIERDSAQLLPLYDVFAQEARVARRWLEPALERLSCGDRVLEVGAGLLLVSCQLQREGFQVTALEPIGIGFSAFAELQALIAAYARARNFAPEIARMGVEDLCAEDTFKLAFSVNVMEHVPDVRIALDRVLGALSSGGEYRFTCPNYWFPYEPHFNIPILINKKVTGIVLRRAIFQSKRVTDAGGTWASLNWINVVQVRRLVTRMAHMRIAFDRRAISRALERVRADPFFAQRRSAWMRAVIGLMVGLRIHRLTEWIPVSIHPIIDCRIWKTGGEAHG